MYAVQPRFRGAWNIQAVRDLQLIETCRKPEYEDVRDLWGTGERRAPGFWDIWDGHAGKYIEAGKE